MITDALRVLVVEDDPAMVALVRAHLAADPTGPWEIAEAGSVIVAVALAADRKPDVVLLDLGLPDASGLSVLEQIRAHLVGVPVVVLTADQDPETGIAAVRAGAQDFLVKGRFPAELIPRSLRYAVERGCLGRELAEREAQYRALFEGSLGFICVHDLDGRLTAVNPAAAHALGFEPSDLQGRLLADLVHTSVRHLVQGYLHRMASIGFDTGLLRLADRTGATRTWEYRNSLRQPTPGEPQHVLGFAVDVTEQRLAERRLREEGLRDTLTGCWNRRWLDRAGASPDFGPTWGCIVVEVEDVRDAEEGRGRRNVEEALIGMARFLAARVRVGDEVVRLDGNDFVLVLNHADEAGTGIVVRRLQEAARLSAPAAFSMGFAVRVERETFEETISRADQRLTVAQNASALAYARRRTQSVPGGA